MTGGPTPADATCRDLSGARAPFVGAFARRRRGWRRGVRGTLVGSARGRTGLGRLRRARRSELIGVKPRAPAPHGHAVRSVPRRTGHPFFEMRIVGCRRRSKRIGVAAGAAPECGAGSSFSRAASSRPGDPARRERARVMPRVASRGHRRESGRLVALRGAAGSQLDPEDGRGPEAFSSPRAASPARAERRGLDRTKASGSHRSRSMLLGAGACAVVLDVRRRPRRPARAGPSSLARGVRPRWGWGRESEEGPSTRAEPSRDEGRQTSMCRKGRS